MTTDLDARLRADGEHWRRAQPTRPSLALVTALAAAIPERDARADATGVLELTGGPPPHRSTSHRRWVWTAVAATVVLLVGAGAGVISLTRHDAGPTTATTGRGASPTTATTGLGATNWVAPGAGTNGFATTLIFDLAAGKLTVTDGCITTPYHLTVGPRTLQIGGVDGVGISCGGVPRPPGLYPAAGDPSVAAQNTLAAVLTGTVTWALTNGTLTLRRGAHTATLYAADTIAQRCAATELTVTAAGATRRYTFGPRPETLTIQAPVDLNAAASGPCRAGFDITLAPATKPFASITHNRYGQWRVTRPGAYQLTFTLNGCTSAQNVCSLGLHPLRIKIQVHP